MTATTKKFKAETLRDQLLEGRPGGDTKLTLISDELIDHSRWALTYSVIFQESGQPENEAWIASYRRGATEMQDESPWEYENEVKATLVCKVTKTVDVWE